VNQLLQRLAGGPAPWGTVQVWPASPGLWERIRLTVYPPGTSRAERRAMEFAHAWPVTGAIAGFIAIVALSGAVPVVATIAIVVIYLLGFWVGARLTRDLRRRSRTITASTVFIAGELTEFGDVELLKETRARLGDLELRRVHGDIDPIQYEAEWADVYSSIPSEPLLALNP
jgi:hypothetical protein